MSRQLLRAQPILGTELSPDVPKAASHLLAARGWKPFPGQSREGDKKPTAATDLSWRPGLGAKKRKILQVKHNISVLVLGEMVWTQIAPGIQYLQTELEFFLLAN